MTRVSQWLFLSFLKNPLTLKYIDNMNQEKEIWKPVVGFEGLYEVSNLGRVKGLERKVVYHDGRRRVAPSVILKKGVNKYGYETVDLSKDGIRYQHKVHRIVALAFIPNPDNKKYIDHINTIRNDNRVENLRWVTRIENAHNPITMSRMIGRNHCGGKTIIEARNQKKSYGAERPVLQISKDGETLREYKSVREAGRNFSNSGAISKCCRGILKTSSNFIWRYKDDYEHQ